MSDTSPILALPLIQPAQAQKHVTHNEALRILDVLVQASVTTRGGNTPPGAPVAGERHITGDAPTGLWAGQPGRIAVWEEPSGWFFLTPKDGWTAHVASEDAAVTFIDGQWAALPDRTLRVARMGIATDADATNVLAVAGPATLLTHAGDDHRITVNKALAADTASLLFQTGWSGRAEMGTTGTDDFVIKVSADGLSFVDALAADRITGRVRFATGIALAAQPSDPISPVDGWVWLNTTLGRLRVRSGGNTKTVGGWDIPWLTPLAGEQVLTCCGIGGAATTTLAGAADRMDIYPFSPGADISIDRISVNCTTAVAASLAKVVIYSSDANGRPDTLVFESAPMDCSTTGTKFANVPLTFVHGLTYWVGVRHSATAALSAWALTATPDINGSGISTAARKILRRTLAFATPAPTTWGYVSSDVSNATATALWLRMA